MAVFRTESDAGRGAGGSVRGCHERRMDEEITRKRIRSDSTDGVDVRRTVVLFDAGVFFGNRERVRGRVGERIVHRGVVRK